MGALQRTRPICGRSRASACGAPIVRTHWRQSSAGWSATAKCRWWKHNAKSRRIGSRPIGSTSVLVLVRAGLRRGRFRKCKRGSRPCRSASGEQAGHVGQHMAGGLDVSGLPRERRPVGIRTRLCRLSGERASRLVGYDPIDLWTPRRARERWCHSSARVGVRSCRGVVPDRCAATGPHRVVFSRRQGRACRSPR